MIIEKGLYRKSTSNGLAAKIKHNSKFVKMQKNKLIFH